MSNTKDELSTATSMPSAQYDIHIPLYFNLYLPIVAK